MPSATAREFQRVASQLGFVGVDRPEAASAGTTPMAGRDDSHPWWPRADDIRAALSYAAWRTEEVELPLP